MQVSLNWLRELVPALSREPDVLARALNSIGLEVEGVHDFAGGLDPVCFATVLATEPHPKRGKLTLVDVDVGGGTKKRVVCGASNVPEPGGVVVFAPLGTHLLAVGLILAPRDIGGVSGEGMLCSEEELGLAASAEGIMTFEPGAFLAGQRFLEAFPGVPDTVFELGITPNRPDALGHIGVARDLAALFGLSFEPPAVALPPEDGKALDEHIRIENRATAACPRYGARVVLNVKVGPSPDWLRWRLHSLGIRPISNVVDITNLLLLEQGNPMHAFDLDRLAGRRIIIRQAAAGETMNTLDEAERALVPTDLIIADADRPSALAGIMGGQDSEIRSETRAVLLECAYFEPTGIRRTSRRLGLQTDSSYRFERGVDFAALERVLARACVLLKELAGGEPIDAQRFADGIARELPQIRLRKRRLEALLGCSVDFDEALSILKRLGFEPLEQGESEAQLRGASHRPDVELEADLIEEVARIRGLDAIPTRLPAIAPEAPSRASRLERRCRRIAASVGLSEAVTYSFVSSKTLLRLGAPEPSVTLENPLTEERDVMTTSLLPGLLEAVQRARRHGEGQIQLFTVASLFLPPLATLPGGLGQQARPRAEDDVGVLPEERLAFAAVLSGLRPAHLSKREPFDVYDAKGAALEVAERLSGRSASVASTRTFSHLHPRAAGEVFLSDDAGRRVSVGRFGQIHPDVADALEVDPALQIVELDLERIETLGELALRFRPIPRLPAVTRDVAFDAPSSLLVEQVERAIADGAGDLCESVELFDVFQPGGKETDRRSLAFRLVFRDPKSATDPGNARTLTDKEVDERQKRVVQAVNEIGAVLRA